MKTQLRYNQQFFQSSSMMRNRRRTTDPRKVACQQQHTSKLQAIDTEPLPRTLQDALRPSKTRSIVITEKEAPFRIVNVNTVGSSYVVIPTSNRKAKRWDRFYEDHKPIP